MSICALTTTRISGRVLDVEQTPLANVPVEIAGVSGLTASDGRLEIDLGTAPLVSDTIKVRGELYDDSIATELDVSLRRGKTAVTFG